MSIVIRHEENKASGKKTETVSTSFVVENMCLFLHHLHNPHVREDNTLLTLYDLDTEF